MRAFSQSDRGDIVLGWLTRLVVIFGIAGVFLFDAISIGTTAMTLTDQGSYAAREASETWQRTGSLQQAYDTAAATATESNPANVVGTKTFTIDQDNTVHLTVSRTASTLLIYRWSKTEPWAEITRDGVGRSVS